MPHTNTNIEIERLDEHQLSDLVQNATQLLREKQSVRRKEVLDQIKQLASSIGVEVEINDPGAAARGATTKPAGSSLKGSKVPARYRDPANHERQWTGRGIKPRWLQQHIEAGRSLEEFAIQ